MQDIVADLYTTFFGPFIVLAPPYLILAAAVAWLVYRLRRIGGGFWRWLVPKDMYLHPSHLIDLQLFIIARCLSGIGVVGAVTVTTLVAALVAELLPGSLLAADTLGPVLLAIVLWVPSDFTIYLMHRFFHRSSVIWPLHAVHHSAEVLTPLTTYRQHPAGLLLSTFCQSVVIGAVQGLLLGTLGPDTPVAEIAGLNACIVVANLALSALHHSHVWLSYGPVLEHVFISPAQHQIHHSTNPAHFDRNFGNFLAVWDWMFGTLYVIRGPEEITFGLTGEMEKPLMTQRLSDVLWYPVRRMLMRSG